MGYNFRTVDLRGIVNRCATVQQWVQEVEPSVLVVEPRILRRVIRLDGRIQGLRQLVFRRETYPITRRRLLTLVEPAELGVSDPGELPERLILLATPEDLDLDETHTQSRSASGMARPLFYAMVRLELENRWGHDSGGERVVVERGRQLGESLFAEIRAVLLQDDRLFQSPTDLETYVEFVASYAEMRYFAPRELTCHFPGVQDWQRVDEIVRQDLDSRLYFERLREHGWFDAVPSRTDAARPKENEVPSGAPLTLAVFRQLQMKAERAAAAGNLVKSVLFHLTAAERGPVEYRVEADTAARYELDKLAQRLSAALDLNAEEAEEWRQALQVLLVAPKGWLLPVEARLLYDLQKTCIERERRIHRTYVWQWIMSLGRRPFQRPLPLLGEVLTLRHLRRASRRVAGTRVDGASRQTLATLLDRAVARVETHTRTRLRRIIGRVFASSGLQVDGGPERIARDKVVEELIDTIVDRGYISMSDLRDALSKNDLKLPDVTELTDLVRGDRLLQTDRAFSDVLDGVYRRGTVYQRWPQVLSSLAFGTRTGRFLTRYVAVPYGGAFLAVECLRHLAHLPTKGRANPLELSDPTTPTAEVATAIQWPVLALVICLGTWILLLMHRPTFLEWNRQMLMRGARLARTWCVDYPLQLIHSEIVQLLLSSVVFGVLRDYVLRPVLFTGAITGAVRLWGYYWSWHVTLEILLGSALFFNSGVGRFLTEWTTSYIRRLWRELRIRVIGSLAQWIMDLFRSLIATIEQVVNLIDEWLRLRRGNSRLIRIGKFLGGIVWFVVSYVLIFVFTLLVEPQVNPIKHFPVVTVSHKLILPTGPAIVKQLSDPDSLNLLSAPMANTLVWTTIWLVPGVFGYLVWELKENWRLYRANRAPTLRPEAVGSHGETMLRLLHPGFHSGTLPKAYCALRRAVQHGEPPESKRYRRKSAVIRRVRLDVQRFVERELLQLLVDQDFLLGNSVHVRYVHASTNRIDVELTCALWPDATAGLTWEYLNGKLHGRIGPLGWISELDDQQRDILTVAVSGLFQRSGVEVAEGPLPLQVTPPFEWTDWVKRWKGPEAPPDLTLDAA